MGDIRDRLERILDPAIRVNTIENLTEDEVTENFDDLIAYRDGVVDTLNAISSRMISITAKTANSKRRTRVEKPAIHYNPEILKLDPNTLPPSVDSKNYLELLADNYQIDVREITKKRNGKNRETTKKAYREAVYTLRRKYGLGYEKIGRLLGRDHSTIFGTYRSICNELDIKP